jgi:hypothetical protein
MGEANAERPQDDFYWRDEILQVMYWYKGEGFGDSVAARDLQLFLNAATPFVEMHLERLVASGYLDREESGGVVRYGFTPFGAKEGARRFAAEFAELINQGHGECPPDCVYCKDQPRDSCTHCSSVA